MLCCRYGFLNNLTLGGPTPLGARAANLTEMTRPFMEEVALNEQVGSACSSELLYAPVDMNCSVLRMTALHACLQCSLRHHASR